MKIKYSKPSSDVTIELMSRATIQSDQLAMQENISSHIAYFPLKKCCILCGAKYFTGTKKTYTNRKIKYFFCEWCGHFQTEASLPDDYPYRLMGKGFDFIYPELSGHQFISRRERF